MFLVVASPFLLFAWASEHLTTKDMTPEELELYEEHKKMLSSTGWA
jgi:hypothetical protein